MALLFGDSQIAVEENAEFVSRQSSTQPLIGGSRRGREASPVPSMFSFRDVMESAKIQSNAYGDSRNVDEGHDKISRSLCFHLCVELGEAFKLYWYSTALST